MTRSASSPVSIGFGFDLACSVNLQQIAKSLIRAGLVTISHIDHLFAGMQRLNAYEAKTNAMTRIGSNVSLRHHGSTKTSHPKQKMRTELAPASFLDTDLRDELESCACSMSALACYRQLTDINRFFVEPP
jgi:hypothetical protein